MYVKYVMVEKVLVALNTCPGNLSRKKDLTKSDDPLPPVLASCKGDRRGMQLESSDWNPGDFLLGGHSRTHMIPGPVLAPFCDRRTGFRTG